MQAAINDACIGGICVCFAPRQVRIDDAKRRRHRIGFVERRRCVGLWSWFAEGKNVGRQCGQFILRFRLAYPRQLSENRPLHAPLAFARWRGEWINASVGSFVAHVAAAERSGGVRSRRPSAGAMSARRDGFPLEVSEGVAAILRIVASVATRSVLLASSAETNSTQDRRPTAALARGACGRRGRW